MATSPSPHNGKPPSASRVDGADSPIAGYQPQGLGNRHYGNTEPSNRAQRTREGSMTGAGLCVRGGKRAKEDSPYTYIQRNRWREERESSGDKQSP